MLQLQLKQKRIPVWFDKRTEVREDDKVKRLQDSPKHIDEKKRHRLTGQVVLDVSIYGNTNVYEY